MSKTKKSSADLQGITDLVTDGTVGIIDLVEELHKRIINPPFLPSTPIQKQLTKLTSFTYKNIKLSTRFIGGGVNKILGQLDTIIGESKTTAEREGMRSIVNGIIGDYLEEKNNPLKITMQFRWNTNTISLASKNINKLIPNINGKILLMIHGSSMNDLQWTRKDHNHGNMLAKDLNKTLIHLRYNSGRHISTNGKDLSSLLEKLVKKWPVPVEEIVIVAHSMGGLVARSAIYYGEQKEKLWTKEVKKIIFLGTPHHGAPLEKAGNYLNVILENIPYAKPFARLGKIRSAGVTDLRYGNLVDEDWKDKDRFKILGDTRQIVPLPKKIACYSIAGNSGKTIKTIPTQFVGDNLVSVNSALGVHSIPAKNLNFKKRNTWIAEKTNHLDLLSNPKVYSKIKSWMER